MSDETVHEIPQSYFDELHALLDGLVPSAEGVICNDPKCNSKLYHRLHELTANYADLLARLKATNELLKASFDWLPSPAREGAERSIAANDAVIRKAEGR